MTLQILPVPGIGDVVPGDDLVALIHGAAPWLLDGDVLVVTSKIVSKAEGRLVEVPADGPERDAARADVLAAETARVVARRGPTTIVQTHHGFVMAAAGIDASNVDKTHLVLLPTDPDASARRLRAGFHDRGLDVGVIVSDTMGRTWRNGLTDVALGAAGIEPFRDHRGETDPYGNELQITQMAVIDEMAAAGELVKGKVDQVPVAVVRGYPRSGIVDGPGATVLLRDAAGDMFSLGTTEARVAGLREAAQLPAGAAPSSAFTRSATSGSSATGPSATGSSAAGSSAAGPGGAGARSSAGPVDPDAVGRAIATVSGHLAPGTTVTAESLPGATARAVAGDGTAAILLVRAAEATPEALIRLGADAHRLRAALAAESIASTPLPYSDAHPTGVRLALSGS